MKSHNAGPVYEAETLRVWETEVERGRDIYGRPQITYITESEGLINGKRQYYIALKY